MADEESSGHTSETDDYVEAILQEVGDEEVKAIQSKYARTMRWDACSTMGHAGSEDSWSDESAVLGGMAPVPEGDEKEAASSHLSSAEEDNNEEPACEAYWCRCPRGCYCAGDGDCCYCERCYPEWTWCNCDCKGCRAHDMAWEAEAGEPTFARASGDSDRTPPLREASRPAPPQPEEQAPFTVLQPTGSKCNETSHFSDGSTVQVQ